jgi:hypothetical protein
MTPSLMGRWQTRFWLIIVIGIPMSTLFAYLYRGSGQLLTPIPLYMLGYILAFGVAWDMLYQLVLTHGRWDYDWPAVYQLISGFTEGMAVYLLIRFVGIPGIARGSLSLSRFWLAYGAVWLAMYLWLFCFMRAVFVRWRFRAGRFGGYRRWKRHCGDDGAVEASSVRTGSSGSRPSGSDDDRPACGHFPTQ